MTLTGSAAMAQYTTLGNSPSALACFTLNPFTGIVYAQDDGNDGGGTAYYSYDPTTDTWTTLASCPLNSGNNGGGVYWNGRIYTCYTGNSTQLGVYDIASNSWSTITNGLGQGTGNIATDGSYIYMVNGTTFKRLDPATNTWTDLAPPTVSFQRWGGLAYYNGWLYGHTGNGSTGFAKYEIATNTWTTLASTPSGAVLGSDIDPVGKVYYCTGSYGGNTMYKFDMTTETWSTETLPWSPTDDGGMAYSCMAGIQGMYVSQGQAGTGFARRSTPAGCGCMVANPGGPYTVYENFGVTLDASSSAGAATYAWDMDNDGVYGDVTGVNPTLTWDQLNTFGIMALGSYTIGLEVDDGSGCTEYGSTVLTVTECTGCCIVAVASNATTTEGSSVTLNGSSSVDAVSFLWDLNNDGTYGDVVGVTPSVSWSTLNTYGITGTGTYIIGLEINDGTLTCTDTDTAVLTVNPAPPSSPATVTTQAVTGITITTATGNGNITNLGTPNPTAHGVCWNTTGSPTVSDPHTDEGATSSTGAFSTAMTGLEAGTTYYVRAYATNAAGTSYGSPVSFTTSDLPTLTCSAGTTTVVCQGTNTIVDAGIMLTGTNAVDGARVSIENYQSGDSLTFNSGSLPSGVTGSWNSATGVLTFTGTATPAQWQALLRTVSMTTTSNAAGTRSVSFTLGGSLPSEDNSHYYEFVADSGIYWTHAQTAASARSLFGMQGYLATITSEAENDFIKGKLNGEGWIGASDAAAEGTWRWVTGPEGLEDGGAGRHFFTQPVGGSGGSAVGSNYDNWNGGEPNNVGNEDYAYMYYPTGTWNDEPNTASRAGYVVEYGGMPGDPTLQISDSKDIQIAYTITVSSTTGGSTDKDGSNTVNHGDTITISPTESTGYHFIGWSGSASGTANPLTVTVTGNMAITANFAINQYTVTVSSTTGGFTDKDGSNTVNHGDTITINPTESTGYHFTGWSGSASGTNDPLTVTVTGNMSITANFAINQYTVTATAGANGSLNGATTSPVTVNHGDTATFTFDAATGYHVASVSGCSGSFYSNTSNAVTSYTYTTGPITGNCTVDATFAINQYTVTATAGAHGSLDGATPSPVTVNHGSTATFTFDAATGYHIASVSGCSGSSYSNSSNAVTSYTYTTGPITGDCTVNATFAINQYTVSATAGTNGSLNSGTPSPVTVDYGDTATFTFNAATGYHVASVSGCSGSSYSNTSNSVSSYTYTTGPITGDCTVNATFAINTYTVTATAGSNGSLDASTPSPITVNYGDTPSFMFNADTGYHVASVSGCFGSDYTNDTNDVATYTYMCGPVTGDCTVDAAFAINRYTVTATAGSNGMLDGSTPSPITVNYGDTPSFTFNADTGYHVASVSGCFGSDYTNDTNDVATYTYTCGPITGDCTVEGAFAINRYTVTAIAGAYGSLDGTTPSPITVNYGDTPSFTFNADTGYHVSLVTGCFGSDYTNDTNDVATYTYTCGPVTADCTVDASFAINRYTVTVTKEGEGSVIPIGDSQVNWGSNFKVNFTPETGYRVSAILVDDIERQGNGNIILMNVQNNHEVHVQFEPSSPPVIDTFEVLEPIGNAPHSTELLASAHDPDGGNIVSYQWHLQGADTEDWITWDGITAFRFLKPGEYLAYVLVTDDEGETAVSRMINIDITATGVFHLPLPTQQNLENSGTVEQWQNIQTYLANPLRMNLDVDLTAVDENGHDLATITIEIPPFAKTRVDESMFDLANANVIRVESDSHLIAYSQLLSNHGQTSSYLSDELTNVLVVPHIAEKADYWHTSAFISNSTDPLWRTIYMESQVGEATYTIERRFGQFLNLSNMLQEDQASPSCWAKIGNYCLDPFLDTDKLTGFEVFGNISGDGAGVELASMPFHKLYVPHLPDNKEIFWSGFAFVNPGEHEAVLTAQFFDNFGTLISESELVIPAGEKVKGLTEELFPEAISSATWGIISSPQPIHGLELFGTHGGAISGYSLNGFLCREGFLPLMATKTGEWTGIAISNPNQAPASIDVQLIDGEGQIRSHVNIDIAPFAREKATLSQLFPELTLNDIDCIRIETSSQVTGFVLTGDLDRTWMTALGLIE